MPSSNVAKQLIRKEDLLPLIKENVEKEMQNALNISGPAEKFTLYIASMEWTEEGIEVEVGVKE